MGNADSVPSQPSQVPSDGSSEDYLRSHLSQRGFSQDALATWVSSLGEGTCSLVQELAAEVRAGLSKLEADEAGALSRCVSVVEVTLTARLPTGDVVLIEEEQIFGDGRRRLRRHRPHVKLRQGEAPTAAAARALQQRLSFSSEAVDRLFPNARCEEASRVDDAGDGRQRPDVEQAVSSTFPGLSTRYALHRVQLSLPEELPTEVPYLGLPDGEAFATAEEPTPSASSAGARDRKGCTVHMWRWVPKDLAGSGRFPNLRIDTDLQESPRDQGSTTTLEETYKDLKAVIKQLERHKTAFGKQGRCLGGEDVNVEGMQERLRRVMQRISNVEDLVHQVNVETVLQEAMSPTSARGTRRTSVGNDLRQFISNNFMEHALFEESQVRDQGGRARAKTMLAGDPRMKRAKIDACLDKNRRFTIGISPKLRRTLGRSSSEPEILSPSGGQQDASSSSEGEDVASSSAIMRQQLSCPTGRTEAVARVLDAVNSPKLAWGRSKVSQSTTWSPSHVRFAGDDDAAADPASSSNHSVAESPWEECVNVEVEAIRASGGDKRWVFDCLTLSHQTNSGSLLVAAELFVMPQVAEFGTPASVMRRYMSALHGRYLQNLNPFHSEAHVALVTHSTRWLVTGGKGWPVAPIVERVATDIAALGHDAGHFRRNNAFCINTGHWLALTYNDRSVLENMHAATVFQLMNNLECDILRGLTKESKRSFRDRVVDLILATDMASHFEFLGQFRVTIASDSFDQEGTKHRELVTKCCLKSADLGHTALPWDLHEPWVLRLLTEFYEQGDEERTLGFTVSPMCAHSSNLIEFKESQKGFLHFVVLPLYKELSQVLESDIAGTCISNIDQNGKQWIEGELSAELVAVITGTSQGVVSPEVAATKRPSGKWLPERRDSEESCEMKDITEPQTEA